MLISLNWLNQYVDIKEKSISELENALTMIGQEVEKIDNKFDYLDTVITAKIVDLKMHEDSDHLTVCSVDKGDEILQVVCGAKNHKLGDIVALATIGTKLSPDFEIKKGKIRGVESYGMLCSLKELGLSDEHDGIVILPNDTPIGISLNEIYDKKDTVFELEITPNRPDCLSYIGIARELACYYNIELKKLEYDITESEEINNTKIDIQEGNICNRYMTRIIKDVVVQDSPKWLKDKIESMGLKSINNLVDLSNYILFELNQPNHIFDLDKISENISVRLANSGESFLTLDEKSLELTQNDIVVCSDNIPIALGGVMGGYNYSVDENTKNILIEVAHFNKDNIRKTSRYHNISSESSYRFERAVDIMNFENVINRLSKLIVENCGGKILKGISDNFVIKPTLPTTKMYLDRLYKFVGKQIDKQKVIEILENLSILVVDNGNELILTPPTHRQDLLNAQDYYEEIIRMYGFDNIENILPQLDIKKDRIVDTTKLNDKIRNICVSLGLNEVINYSFIPKNALDLVKYDSTNTIVLENPINEDFSVMRNTLIYSLIKNAKDNSNRSVESSKFFEISRVFEKIDDKYIETTKLGIILSGSMEKTIFVEKTDYDFYHMKGIFESIFEKLNIKSYQIERSKHSSLHPGMSADVYIGRECLGSFGFIHPDVEENFSLNAIVLELNLDKLRRYIKENIKYEKISKYQSTTRDIAFLVKDDLLIGNAVKSLEKLDRIIKSITIFDIYTGPGIEKGYKSFAINILMQDNKTLEEKEINDVVDKIKDKMISQYGATVR